MTPEQFMSKYGVTGFVTTTNGPRLYVDRVRHHGQIPVRRNVQQRAFICLATHTAHCFTYGSGLSPYQCQSESKDIQRKLAPLARLARIQGVAPGGRPIPITQPRLIYTMLHEAGVQSAIEDGCITLDINRLVRAAFVPYLPTKERYEVFLRPDRDNAWQGRSWPTREALLAELGSPTEKMRLVIRALKGDHEPEVMDRLADAANGLLLDVFREQWNPSPLPVQ